MSRLKFSVAGLLALILFTILSGGCVPSLAKIAAKVAATPEPTATLAAGWKRFENKGVSIALPDTFAGGDLTTEDQQSMVESLKDQGGEFNRIAEFLKKNPDVYLLYVIDTEPAEGGLFTNASVVREKVLSVFDTETYAKAAQRQLPASFKVMSQEALTLLNQPATRLVIEATVNNIDLKQAMYIIRHDDYMYTVTFATASETFEDKLPIFEQSIETFAVQP